MFLALCILESEGFLTGRLHKSLWDYNSLAHSISGGPFDAFCVQRDFSSCAGWSSIWWSASPLGRQCLIHQPQRWGPERAFHLKQSQGVWMVSFSKCSLGIHFLFFVFRGLREERARAQSHIPLIVTQNFWTSLTTFAQRTSPPIWELSWL